MERKSDCHEATENIEKKKLNKKTKINSVNSESLWQSKKGAMPAALFADFFVTPVLIKWTKPFGKEKIEHGLHG